MIELDYKIIRSEGDETKTYGPNRILKKIDNVSYIKGPNSTGKSTLLNIVALAFHGLKNNSIPKDLKLKMQNLMEADYQNITFKLKIKKNSTDIIIEKNNPKANDIKVYEITEEGKNILTKEVLDKKYKLIYDIPERPTRKIFSLLDEIETIQSDVGKKVTHFKTYLVETISEIRSSRDPRQIKNLEKEIRNLSDSLVSLIDSKNEKADLLNQFEKSVYCQFYRQYKNKLENLQRRKEKLQKDIKRKTHKDFKTNQEYGNNIRWAQKEIREALPIFDELKDLLIRLLPKEKNRLKILHAITLSDIMKEFELPSDLAKEEDYFHKQLDKEQNKIEDKKNYKSAKFYEELLELMDKYSTDDVELPGIGKNLGSFTKELKDRISENESDIKFVENANTAKQLFERLNEILNNINIYYLPKLRNLKKKATPKDKKFKEGTLTENQIDEIDTDIESTLKKVEFYDKKYAQKGKPSYDTIIPIGEKKLKRYRVFTEDQLIDEIDRLKSELKNLGDTIKDDETRIERKKGELQTAKSKKDHKFAGQLDRLEQILELIKSAEYQLINEMSDYMKALKEPKDSSKKQSETYNKAIGKFVGDRIRKVRHGSQSYDVKSVDLLKECIETTKGKIIRFVDMGTGQSQSAYILGLLHASDHRKIIALFDEVAMMDDKSIKPIIQRLRELYKEDKLIVGIMVQKGNKLQALSQIGDVYVG